MQRNTIHFIGIGGYCSGAGFLYRYVHEHPKTCVIKKATNFFSNNRKFIKGYTWYESNFKGCGKGKVVGECVTDYLYAPESAKRISELYPNVKLLAVVCNPIERLVCEYNRAKKMQVIQDDVDIVTYIESNPDCMTRGLFGKQLDEYFKYYSSLQLMVCVHEDRYDDPVDYVKKVYEFLEIDTNFISKDLRGFVSGDEYGDFRPLWLKILLKVTLPLKWLGIFKLFKFLHEKIFKQIKVYLQRKGMFQSSKESLNTENKNLIDKRPIDEELYSVLCEYYEPDVRKLSQILHRDMNSEWGIEKTT